MVVVVLVCLSSDAQTQCWLTYNGCPCTAIVVVHKLWSLCVQVSYVLLHANVMASSWCNWAQRVCLDVFEALSAVCSPAMYSYGSLGTVPASFHLLVCDFTLLQALCSSNSFTSAANISQDIYYYVCTTGKTVTDCTGDAGFTTR